ncbi:MAG TPA: hypothetical protein VF941_02065, partial [Clostridia bacterium]
TVDFLIGGFAYLFFEISKKHEIPLHIMNGTNGILPLKLDVGSANDIRELASMINHNLKMSITDNASSLHPMRLKPAQENDSISLLFTYNAKNLNPELASSYDVILKAEEGFNDIACAVEYNSKCIKKESVDEIFGFYTNILEVILERAVV